MQAPARHAQALEQRPHLRVAGMFCKLLDGVTAIPQDALIPVDVGDAGLARGCVDIPACIEGPPVRLTSYHHQALLLLSSRACTR